MDGQTKWVSDIDADDLDQGFSSGKKQSTGRHQRHFVELDGAFQGLTGLATGEFKSYHPDHLLHGFARASQLLLIAVDLEIFLPQVLCILGSAADADRVYICQKHPHAPSGDAAMSMRYEWTQANIAPRSSRLHCQNQLCADLRRQPWYRALATGEPIREWSHHFAESKRLELKQDGIMAVLMVPIFVNRELWGYIGFDSCRSSREWLPSDESILVAIAAGIGSAIKRQLTEHKMRHQARHDPLTGLPNRAAFNHQLTQAISHAQASGSCMAVIFLDLDRFKTINDTLGHAIGDKLLIQVTQRFRQELREPDKLARWSGDEFAVLLPDMKSPEAAALIAKRLSNALKSSFSIEGHKLYVTSSMGIAAYPEDGEDVTVLLQNAGAAMHAAKAYGRNTHSFYTTTLNASASQQLALEKHLREALQRDELQLFFQPQINIDEGRVDQLEALMRWDNPQLGWVSPGDFIQLAEEIGLIAELGDWVLKEACSYLRTCHQSGFDSLSMAVNLSAHQIQQPTLVENIEQVLRTFDLSPHYLELEITETADVFNAEASAITLNQLRELGTRVVMDDFGTGYSSFSYLKQFPFNGLKIDRSFIEGIPTDAQNVAMLRAIMALGHELDLRVVAEGVETHEQIACLRSLNCSNVQGYWFSYPLDSQNMTTFLETHWPTYNAGID